MPIPLLPTPLRQALAEATAHAVESSGHWLCHPWITFLQFHGIIPGLLLGSLWLLSGWARLQELRRLRSRLPKSPQGACTPPANTSAKVRCECAGV